MKRRVIGLVVASSGGAPLVGLGVPDLLALTPFAGTYRVVDFALAALRNAGIQETYVLAPRPVVGDLRAHLEDASGPGRAARRRVVVPLPGANPGTGMARIVTALRAARHLLRILRPDAIVVLSADHLLVLDARQLLAAHRAREADVLLVGLPMPSSEAVGRLVLEADRRGRLLAARQAAAPGEPRLATVWTGEAVVRADAVATILGLPTASGDPAAFAALHGRRSVAVFDASDTPLPGTTAGVYWHEPTSVESYYGAQMALCTARPALDLYNPDWPVPVLTDPLPPAKVVADQIGRAGQAIDSLLSDGAVIRGGVVIKSVVGRGVLVESGAEIEDSILLDGCRIGRGARVRRAVVGAGVRVGDQEAIGYDAAPPAPARVLRSGLTLVPPPALAARDAG